MGRFLISGLYTRIVKFMGLPSSVLNLKILKDAYTKVMKQDANSVKIEDPSLLDLPRQTLIAFGLLLLLVLFMIWDQFFWWQTNDEYSFGYLVPLFAAYVAYDRWPLIRGFLFGSSDGGSDRAQKTQSNSFFVKFFLVCLFISLVGYFGPSRALKILPLWRFRLGLRVFCCAGSLSSSSVTLRVNLYL